MPAMKRTRARTPAAAAPDPAPPPMEVVALPVDGLHQDPANARRHGERNLDSIKAALVKFGQQKPIVVNADDVVIAGNGTLLAARALGWETLACVRTGLGRTDQAGYAIADNRTAELAEWDETALAATLRSLQSEDLDLAAVGYTAAEVDGLCDRLGDAIVPDFGPSGPDDQGRLDEKSKTECPSCGHRFTA